MSETKVENKIEDIEKVESKKVKAEKKKLSISSTVLVTIAAVLGVIVVGRIIYFCCTGN